MKTPQIRTDKVEVGCSSHPGPTNLTLNSSFDPLILSFFHLTMPLAQKFRPTGEFMTKFDSFSQRIAVSPGEKLYLLYKDQFMVFSADWGIQKFSP